MCGLGLFLLKTITPVLLNKEFKNQIHKILYIKYENIHTRVCQRQKGKYQYQK